MMFVTVQHPERDDLRVLIVANVDQDLPYVSHLYLEKRKGKDWERTRKIKGGLLQGYLRRLKFDENEVAFALEEAAQEYEGDGE